MTQPKAINPSYFFIFFEIVIGISKTPGTLVIFMEKLFKLFFALFSKDEENIFKENVKTNTNGVGKLKLFDNRIYLLSAVYIEKNSYFKKIKKKADWSSEWASLVFKR